MFEYRRVCRENRGLWVNHKTCQRWPAAWHFFWGTHHKEDSIRQWDCVAKVKGRSANGDNDDILNILQVFSVPFFFAFSI